MIQNSFLCLMPFWKGINDPASSSWDPPIPIFAGGANAFETFLLFDKITFLIKLGPSWLHFGRFWDP